MTSVLRGEGGVSQFLTIRGGGCVISILKILTGGGGGSKIPKITLTSFVLGPKNNNKVQIFELRKKTSDQHWDR